MKKRILTVCIAILIVFVCVFCAACTSRESFEVRETSLREGGESTASLVKEICEKYPERTMGTGKDYEFLKYLSEKMASYGYPAADFGGNGGETGDGGSGETVLSDTLASATVEINEFNFENYYTKAVEKGYDLVYRIPAAEKTERDVLLIAAYDNSAGLEITSQDLTTGQITTGKVGGEGAYSNATGVAVLLRIAYELANKSLPYNLTIAFADCSENGWEGAIEVVVDYFSDKKDNFICLNFNKLGLGDYTYIYSDESSQAYNDYFYSVVGKTDDSGIFADIPINKQIAEVKFIDAQKTEYSHFAMYGDNLIFNVYGLAVASYVSFNWSSFENPFYTETAGYENLLGTSADTYDTLIERLGGGQKGEAKLEERLDAVVLNAVTAVSTENAETLFKAVAQSDPAKSSDFASSTQYASLIVRIVIIIAAVGVAVYFVMKCRTTLLKKQKEKLERMQKEVSGGGANAMPKAEDIFSMGGDFEEKDDSSDDKKDGENGTSGGGDIFEGF